MQNFSIFPREMAASLWRNRGLIIELINVRLLDAIAARSWAPMESPSGKKTAKTLPFINKPCD